MDNLLLLNCRKPRFAVTSPFPLRRALLVAGLLADLELDVLG